VLFFIHHGSRHVFLAGITTNPTREWVAQVVRNVTAELRGAAIPAKYLLYDRDDTFAQGFDAMWESEGASIVRSPVRAPNENAAGERWVRIVRSECTDRFPIVNERYLGRVLVHDVRHYDGYRPHRGRAMQAPYCRSNATSSAPARITRIGRHEVRGRPVNEFHAA
jgi:hypothetical protein